MTVVTDPDPIDAALKDVPRIDDDDHELPQKHRAPLIGRIAAAIRGEHAQFMREFELAQTMHVHDVPHVPVVTTEPLAHLKEPAKNGATTLILQPRHAGHAFTKLTVGTEEVEAVEGVAAPRYTEPPAEMPAWVVGARLWKPEVNGAIVTLTKPLKHSHDVGVAVSVEGFDPESVHADDVVCHDCGRELVADVTYERVLVCQKVHGHRPTEMVPKNPDGAVECGQKE
jgi:hypothetical protein